MRPPVQKTALQQNEANRLQHHQQQQQTHKHLQQQKQLQQQHTDIIATNINDLQQAETIARKSKLEQRELLVENHLNSACFAQVHHNQQQPQQLQLQQTVARQTLPVSAPTTTATTRTIARKSLPTYYNGCYQPIATARESSTTVKLLDLSTSPPSLNETSVFHTQTTSAEIVQNRISTNANNPLNNSQQQQQQRFSFASQVNC